MEPKRYGRQVDKLAGRVRPSRGTVFPKDSELAAFAEGVMERLAVYGD